jgi:hypothetical protein
LENDLPAATESVALMLSEKELRHLCNLAPLLPRLIAMVEAQKQQLKDYEQLMRAAHKRMRVQRLEIDQLRIKLRWLESPELKSDESAPPAGPSASS